MAQTAGTTTGAANAATTEVNPGEVKALLEEVIRETSRNQILETDTPAVQQFKMYRAKAKLYAESGFFKLKDGNTNQAIAQAFTLIEIGASMGFGEAMSMQGIAIVSNRPVLSSQMLATRMQELGYDWDPYFWQDDKGNCTGCQLFMKYQGKPMLRPKRNPDGSEKRNAAGAVEMEQASVRFTAEDATRMKLQENEWVNGNKTTQARLSLQPADLQVLYGGYVLRSLPDSCSKAVCSARPCSGSCNQGRGRGHGSLRTAISSSRGNAGICQGVIGGSHRGRVGSGRDGKI
jgi:hypothetical protein